MGISFILKSWIHRFPIISTHCGLKSMRKVLSPSLIHSFIISHCSLNFMHRLHLHLHFCSPLFYLCVPLSAHAHLLPAHKKNIYSVQLQPISTQLSHLFWSCAFVCVFVSVCMYVLVCVCVCLCVCVYVPQAALGCLKWMQYASCVHVMDWLYNVIDSMFLCLQDQKRAIGLILAFLWGAIVGNGHRYV